MPYTVCRKWQKRNGCQYKAIAGTTLCAACRPAEVAAARKVADAARRGTGERGYDAAWNELSKIYRAAHPLCEVPGCGRDTALTDHLVALAVALEWRLDALNLWALCRNHHRVKTLIEIRLGLVREGEGGRESAGVGLADLGRLTITVDGVARRAAGVLRERAFWIAALNAGVEGVRGQWRA
jgi:5-methylcytosine-specific restriction endonuclease McrA